ncbi:MAG: methyltransferase domain-containing protein [Armatimonadetes bacterium]|nr:methyltransferase domain-containing protein [Armatimonadota bacterium]
MNQVTLGNFDPLAKAYEAARPGYPRGLLEKLLSRVDLREGERIVDIGAGTGKFTRLLAVSGHSVTAVEPGEAMRAEGIRATASPGLSIDWRPGTAEDTGLPDACAGWVALAQAFHWVRPEAGLPEIHRILREGGHLTVLWNSRQMEAAPLLRAVRQLIDQNAPGFEDKDHSAPWEDVLVSTGHFEDAAIDETAHTVPMSKERFLNLWRSYNKLQVRLGPERFARFLEQLGSRLADCPEEPIEIPYLCRAWTVRRVG